MTEQANSGYNMCESRQIEENFESLKELFINMSHAANQFEQQKAKLEEDIKILTDANAALHECNNRLVGINEMQRTMFDQTLEKTVNLLKTELDNVKKENLILKGSTNNNNLPKSHAGTIENYNSLLQKKIGDLEKQLLQNQTLIKQKSSLHCTKHEKELFKLKTKNNALHLENKNLTNQFTNFRNLHNQIVSEMRLNNLKNSYGGNHQASNNSMHFSPMAIDAYNQNELQPLQVNVIESDVD